MKDIPILIYRPELFTAVVGYISCTGTCGRQLGFTDKDQYLEARKCRVKCISCLNIESQEHLRRVKHAAACAAIDKNKIQQDNDKIESPVIMIETDKLDRNVFQRVCPKCKKVIEYGTKCAWKTAMKRGGGCYSCSKKKYYTDEERLEASRKSCRKSKAKRTAAIDSSVNNDIDISISSMNMHKEVLDMHKEVGMNISSSL